MEFFVPAPKEAPTGDGKTVRAHPTVSGGHQPSEQRMEAITRRTTAKMENRMTHYSNRHHSQMFPRHSWRHVAMSAARFMQIPIH